MSNKEGVLRSGISARENLRGVFLAKGPDSVGGVPVEYCPDEVHMEEEEVQVKVQAEEEKIGENTQRGTR